MARRVYYRLFNAMGSLLIGSELARLRRPLQLPRIRRMFHWWFSPDLMIGLFPSWFGTPQDDWPSQLTLAGFPRGDSGRVRDLSASTEEFLKAGTPPVVFTFGTGMKHATRLFRQCLEACRQIGMRSIFITQYQDQLPLPLPSFALHGSFEPFAALFARCAAIVHHGGIGTTAAALAAGTPQLILPFAFDQLDNARRVHGQGMGTWLDRRHRSSTEIANTLAVLTAEFPRERGAALIARCRECDGLARAADIFEERG